MVSSPNSKKKGPAPASTSAPPFKKIKKNKKKFKKRPDRADRPERAPAPAAATEKNGASTSAARGAVERKHGGSEVSGTRNGTRNGSAKKDGRSGTRNGSEKDEKSAGFIFMCSGKTKPECYRYRVFGLPKGKIEMVEKIKPGARLFLYDFDLKLLYGIYKATTKGRMDLEKNAFRGNFPAQVKFKIEKDCLPLPESTFKHAIPENYQKGKFTPELNSKQVRKLMSLFKPVHMEPRRAPPVKYVEDWHPSSGHIPFEDQYRHVQVASPPRLPPEDAYRPGQLARAPHPVELRYTHQLAPSANDSYAYSVQPPVPITDSYVHSRVPGAVETQHVQPSVYSSTASYYQAPPIDPYQVDSLRAYQPENPLGTESVIRYRLVPEVMSRDPLLVRDYRTVTGRDEVLQSAEQVDELYNPERAVISSAHLASQSAYWSAHEDPNRAYTERAYGGSLARTATNGSAPSTVPVSSLYSFAGATPAYR